MFLVLKRINHKVDKASIQKYLKPFGLETIVIGLPMNL